MLLAGMLAITLLLTVSVTSAQQPFTVWRWTTPYECIATTSLATDVVVVSMVTIGLLGLLIDLAQPYHPATGPMTLPSS